MTFNNNFSLSGTGYKPIQTFTDVNWTQSTYTFPSPPTQIYGSLTGDIRHENIAYQGKFGVTHSTGNAIYDMNIGRSGVDNKGSNTYSVSAKYYI